MIGGSLFVDFGKAIVDEWAVNFCLVVDLLYKNHFDTLKSQVAQKKKEKKLRKRQKKEVLELSDAQIKAQEEGSTAYYLVQNSRKEIDQYLAKCTSCKKK